MRAEIENLKNQIEQSLNLLKDSCDIESMQDKIASLESLSHDPNFWNNASKAADILKEKKALEYKIDNFLEIDNGLKDSIDLAELAESEDDTETLTQIEKDLQILAVKAHKLETESLFSDKHDINDCFLEINAGAGGTESHDWSQMMMRMYLRFVERMGFKAEIINIINGEEAGIKSCTIRVKGHMAYGWLKTESGVHRLVRISPYNASGKRMTSFASAWVYPEIDDSIEVEIDEKDLRIDTYRSSGAGGQHVNTTDSAVRITHIPTNIAVQCQNDRSQHKNKAEAMKMLKARLYDLKLKEQQAEIDAKNATKTEIGWGHQIRSYVLQPYQMVKDARTGYETSDANGVLDGDLEDFVSNTLAWNAKNKKES